MPKIKMPELISPPQPGALRYTDISSETDPIGEYAVRFSIDDRSYLSFVHAKYIDLKRKLVSVSVIGKFDDGWYVIDLPSETLTSGSRMKVREGAPELVYDPQ